MSYHLIGLWGCANFGTGVDLWNCQRTSFYWKKHAPRSFGVDPSGDGCCNDLDDYWPGSYTDPVTDNAWWYTTTRPESGRFFGFQALAVSGIDEAETDRDSRITASCNGSLVHGPLQDSGYTIVVEGVLRGLSCCDVRYGLEALREQLRGCGCGSSCNGTRLRMLSPVPRTTPTASNYVPPSGTTSPWRTYTNVVLKEQPVVTSTTGASCGSCGCGDTTFVRFTLRANPGQYLEEEELLAETLIRDNDMCDINCDDAACEEDTILLDPLCSPLILPDPPTVTASCFEECFLMFRRCIDATIGNTMFPTELEARIYSGTTALRNLKVSIWKKIPGKDFESGAYTKCNRCAGFAVSYIPPASVWERSVCDGVRVKTARQTYNASSTLLTPSGTPGSPCVRLPCGDVYICIESDIAYTAPDATITLYTREVEP